MAAEQPVPIRRSVPPDLRHQVGAVRAEAEARYGEVDLLVAALREHIADLRAERDRLIAEVERLRGEADRARDDARRIEATWMWRGTKPPRSG